MYMGQFEKLDIFVIEAALGLAAKHYRATPAGDDVKVANYLEAGAKHSEALAQHFRDMRLAYSGAPLYKLVSEGSMVLPTELINEHGGYQLHHSVECPNAWYVVTPGNEVYEFYGYKGPVAFDQMSGNTLHEEVTY